MKDLKPCPFCGAPAYMWSWNGGTIVQCEKYDANTHRISIEQKTQDEAIKAWNKRANDEQRST